MTFAKLATYTKKFLAPVAMLLTMSCGQVVAPSPNLNELSPLSSAPTEGRWYKARLASQQGYQIEVNFQVKLERPHESRQVYYASPLWVNIERPGKGPIHVELSNYFERRGDSVSSSREFASFTAVDLVADRYNATANTSDYSKQITEFGSPYGILIHTNQGFGEIGFKEFYDQELHIVDEHGVAQIDPVSGTSVFHLNLFQAFNAR